MKALEKQSVLSFQVNKYICVYDIVSWFRYSYSTLSILIDVLHIFLLWNDLQIICIVIVHKVILYLTYDISFWFPMIRFKKIKVFGSYFNRYFFKLILLYRISLLYKTINDIPEKNIAKNHKTHAVPIKRYVKETIFPNSNSGEAHVTLTFKSFSSF